MLAAASRISSPTLADSAGDEVPQLFQRLEMPRVAATRMLDATAEAPLCRTGVEPELQDEAAVGARLMIDAS